MTGFAVLRVGFVVNVTVDGFNGVFVVVFVVVVGTVGLGVCFVVDTFR
jgi:hypothetical protein